MNKGLHLRDHVNSNPNALASVITMRPVIKPINEQKEGASIPKSEKQIPLFYTEPIFNGKDRDFL
jgi:hypothetical protein